MTDNAFRTLGPGAELPNDFVVAVISAVGNYGEIYDRAFGPETALDLGRAGRIGGDRAREAGSLAGASREPGDHPGCGHRSR